LSKMCHGLPPLAIDECVLYGLSSLFSQKCLRD
jgi:hypothetical protein